MTEFRNARPEDRENLTALWEQAFGDGRAYIDAFFETGFSPERSRTAVIGGEIAGMLYWFDCVLGEKTLAYIYAVATDARFRGRGIATGLMENVHVVLRKQGYAGAVLSPGSEPLFRFYKRLGYKTAGYRREERCSAGSRIPVREIGQAEYAALRRKLLPEHGIRQEDASLRFLHRFVRFYGGVDFCAAVSRGESFFPEFLGDPEGIPGLLASLGIPEATVRMPGSDVPCAMVKWFDCRGGGELYLGFPFD